VFRTYCVLGSLGDLFPLFDGPSKTFADRFVDLRQVGQLGCTHKT